MSTVQLPPMPPNYHGWWKDQKTERIEIKKTEPCRHIKEDGTTAFAVNGNEAQCTKCHLGFDGEGFEIRDGKLCNNRIAKHIK